MRVSRRAFLSTSAIAAGGALVIGFSFRDRLFHHGARTPENPFDAWIRINPDSTAQLVFAKSEMGQGVYTSLPMILADEADIDWERTEIVQSDFSLGTGGSGSVQGNYLPLRRAGATVRTLMIAAAARRWSVPESECATAKSAVLHSSSGRSLSYGELVPDARRLPLPDPAHLALKDPSRYLLIGRDIPHRDIPAKCSGTAVFGLDVRRPGMVHAVIARCPTFGGSPARFDAARALATPGVLQVFEVPARGHRVFTAGGIVVVAKNTWAAIQGRKMLDITWNHGPHVSETTESLHTQMRDLLGKPPQWSSEIHGPDPDTVAGAKRIETVYEFPFLSHACMEPMNITVHVHDGMCEAWCPSQCADMSRTLLANELGMSESNVTVHTTFMGGGFGRRYQYDFQTEAAQIARHVSSPVQLVWTREDDMTHDFYRPAGMRRMRGAVDASGNILAWSDFLVDPSINAQWNPQKGINGDELPGRLIYPIPHIRTHFSLAESAVPRAWWRSVENSFNGFSVESFVDELAHAANMDPYQFRRRLLQQPQIPEPKPSPDERPFDPQRLIAVLDLATQKAGWGKPLGPHRGRGISCTATYAYLAQVAEVTVERDTIRVDRLVTAVDCGQVINPCGARSQLEGGAVFTLSSILDEAITIQNGAAKEQNFDDYQVIRMPEVPTLETWFIESHEDPHGLGEAAVGLTGPAVANAIFAATGKRMHKMPFRMDEPAA
ncbi:MAG TPA: molybdopterin cofactor-binding domain-containing protein [Terracidiphilus sp.]|nr:molybdopterin cofactor-binding domain-containing protein [Terracidiphilus sp.]